MKKHPRDITRNKKKSARPKRNLPSEEGHCVGELNIIDQSVTFFPKPGAGPNVLPFKIAKNKPLRRRRP